MNRGAIAVALLVLAVLAVAAAMNLADRGADDDAGGMAFEERAAAVGLNYTNIGEGISNTNAGVYVADYDRDGWTDVLLVGGRRPVLFENDGGEFAPSGALPELPDDVIRVHSAVFLDYDADGDEDLLLLTDPGVPVGDYTPPANDTVARSRNASHPVLLRNTGKRYVVQDTLDHVPLRKWPIGAATGDVDRDGCPDLFVYQDGDWADRTPVGHHDASSIGNVTDDNGEPNYLLAGDCEGGFERVGAESGIEGERWSLAASVVDFTGDGWPDIHVANDFNLDVLYVNQGDGSFEQRMMDGTDRNGMSSEVADVNGDGRLDVFVTNIADPVADRGDLGKDTGRTFRRKGLHENPRHAGNQLMINRGNGSFVDRAEVYGVRRPPALWGWAAVLDDLDNDGDVDLIHANNEVSSTTSYGSRPVITRTDTPPAAFERLDDGTFEWVPPTTAGLEPMNGRGMARLDADRDGDLDVVVADDGDDVGYFENVADDGAWLQVRVLDRNGAPAIGAEVTVTVVNASDWATRTDTVRRVQNAKVDFLSQGSRLIHVGLGDAGRVERVTVRWPDGSTVEARDVAPGRRYRATRDGLRPVPPGGASP